MPSLALATGAGASSGLEELLARLRAETVLKQNQQRIDEEMRSNQAREGLEGRKIDEGSLLRLLTQAGIDDQRKEKGAEIGTKSLSIGSHVPATKFKGLYANTTQEPNFAQDQPPETVGLSGSGFGGDKAPPQEPDRIYQGNDTQREAEKFRVAQDKMIADPNTEEDTRSWLKLRRVIPKGEAPPPTDIIMGRKPGTEASAEMKTVVLDGKPVDVNYNPKTQRFTYRGQDVTEKVGHYTAPTPSVVIQSDLGPAFANPRAPNAPVTPIRRADGSQVQPQLPANVRARMNTADKVASHVDDAIELLNEADKRGLIGPVMGRWADLLGNKIGSTGNPENDKLLGELAFNLSGLRTGFALVHGGQRGGGSAQMAEMWKQIFDSNKMSKDRILGALAQEKKWLATYGSGGGEKPDTSDNDPLGLGIKR